MATNRDIFNEVISEKNRNLLTAISERNKKVDILKQVEKELPSIVRSYVKKQTNKINTLTPKEITNLVEEAISSIPKPKPQKIIEKTIVRQVEKKDPIKYVQAEELEDLKAEIKKLKGLIKARDKAIAVQYIGTMIPNYNGLNDVYLRVVNGQLVWNEVSGSSSGSDPFYIGDQNTDGSWRLLIINDTLSVQRRESSAWVEKGSFLA